MFPIKPDHLGVMPPIPAVATIPTSASARPYAEVQQVVDEVEQRVDEFFCDLQPTGHIARFFARRAATLSVRLDRLAKYDAAAVAQRVRRAASEFDLNRLSEVNHLFSWINAEPLTYTQRLRQSPEGIAKLLESWETLRCEITHPLDPRWGIEHRTLAESLLGRRSNDLPATRFAIYTDAYFNNYSPLVEVDPELAPLTQAARKQHAMIRLAELIKVEIDRLTEARAAIDDEAIALDRQEAADRALFDPSPQGAQFRRYEVATERSMHRALQAVVVFEEMVQYAPEIEPEVTIDPADLAAEAAETTPDPTTAEPKIETPAADRLRLAARFRRAAHRAADARAVGEPDARRAEFLRAIWRRF